MQRDKMVFHACGIIAAVALVLGGFLAIANGLQAPPWLLGAELAVLSALAAACCFTKLLPALLPWLTLKPVQGTLLLVGGVLAVYVPPQFVVAAVMLALGSRLIWAEACRLADGETPKRAASTTLAKAEPKPPARSPATRPAVVTSRIVPPQMTRVGSVDLILGDD